MQRLIMVTKREEIEGEAPGKCIIPNDYLKTCLGYILKRFEQEILHSTLLVFGLKGLPI